MVEDVVEVHTYLELGALAESEALANTKIHAPRAWSNKRIPLRYVRGVEDFSTRSRKRESAGIEELIAGHTRVRITNDARTETWTTEIAHCVNKAAGDVTREYRIAVIACPERRESSARLGKQ